MYPDLEYIRRFVPVHEVALELGLRVTGRMVHCWRPENHRKRSLEAALTTTLGF